MNGDQINKETSEALWAFISEAFEEWQKQGGRLDLDVDSELMEKVWVQWEATPPIHPDTKLKSLDCLMDMLVEEFSARYLRDDVPFAILFPLLTLTMRGRSRGYLVRAQVV